MPTFGGNLRLALHQQNSTVARGAARQRANVPVQLIAQNPDGWYFRECHRRLGSDQHCRKNESAGGPGDGPDPVGGNELLSCLGIMTLSETGMERHLERDR